MNVKQHGGMEKTTIGQEDEVWVEDSRVTDERSKREKKTSQGFWVVFVGILWFAPGAFLRNLPHPFFFPTQRTNTFFFSIINFHSSTTIQTQTQ